MENLLKKFWKNFWGKIPPFNVDKCVSEKFPVKISGGQIVKKKFWKKCEKFDY